MSYIIQRYKGAFFVVAVLVASPFFAFANGGDVADHAHEGETASTFQEEADVGEGVVVQLSATPLFPSVGTTTLFDFFVNVQPEGTPVSFSELDVSHTKLLHVIGVRSDMEEFLHIHPRPQAGGVFTIEHIFQKPGIYKLWSEITKGETEYTFGHPELDVSGEGARSERTISFGKNVVVGDNVVGHYQVFLDAKEPIAKGRPHELAFDVHTAEGQGVELESFLGAKMHLVAVKDDFEQFIHGHPEGAHTHGSAAPSNVPAAFDAADFLVNIAHANGVEEGEYIEPEKVNFHMTFPEVGIYKVFVEFRPAGIGLPADEALRAGFWVNVGEAVISPQIQWWILLITSLILMTLLSFAVHRYINKE